MVGSVWRYGVRSVADNGTGRSWTVGELRSRDFDTLHQLWWICVKDRNRLATEKIERKRLEAGYGDYENQQRDKTIQETMKAILDTLAERHQAYQEAFELAKHDPNIDLSRTDGPQYEVATPYVRLVLSYNWVMLTALAGRAGTV
jgi:large subunit ribosomal protein L47